MVATPPSAVATGGIVASLFASSAPLTVTVAPGTTALLGSTTVTRSVPVEGGWADTGPAASRRSTAAAVRTAVTGPPGRRSNMRRGGGPGTSSTRPISGDGQCV